MPVRRYAKAVVAALVPILLAVQAALTDEEISSAEWIAILIAVIGAVGVWRVPNRPPAGQPSDPNVSEQGYGVLELLLAVVCVLAIVWLIVAIF